MLVPFDHSALRRLWNVERNSTADFINVFVDKTFQIKFHVSPPVLSDWKDFLIEHLTEAFPNHTTIEDYDKIYSLYRIYRSVKYKDRPPTPRDIKVFINQIGAYHRIWGDSILLYYQALYVLYKIDIHSNFEAFSKPDFIDQRIKNTIGDDFLRWMAVLHFNVEPPNKALQILIGKDIEDAFRNRDQNILRTLSNTPGFLVVCEQMVEENINEWIKTEPEIITSAAYVLEDLSKDTEISLTNIWNHIHNAIPRVESLPKLDEAIGNGLAAIMKASESEEYEMIASHIIQLISKTEITGVKQDGTK